MCFYLKPPRGVITFDKLEACVNQRLDFYDNIDNKKFEFDNFDCLLEDTGLDRTGHYLLRLYATLRQNFGHRFIQNEQKLLNVRLNSYDQQDTKRFLKRLAKQCQDVLAENLSKEIQKFCLFLKWLTTQMLNPEFLRHIFDVLHIKNNLCSQIFFSVPFQYCHSLISNREFNLSFGNVEIDCKSWKRILVSVYGTYLKMILKEMKSNKFVEDTLTDIRIKEIMGIIKERNSRKYEQINKDRFNINKIQEESRLFPLCMKSLYTSSIKTNRLGHNDRFDFSLFMKGIGVTIGDSLKFWEDMYSKQHSSCSRCTHSWQKNERKYIYGIRHLYGLEGSRRNYLPRSCSFLQEKTVGYLEEGGCPFTHFDDHNLKKLLKSILPEDENTIEVIIHQRKINPSDSCKLLHKNMYKKGSELKKHSTEFQSPVQYYILLREGFKECDK